MTSRSPGRRKEFKIESRKRKSPVPELAGAFGEKKSTDLRSRIKRIDSGRCEQYVDACTALDLKMRKELEKIELLRQVHALSTNNLYDFDCMAARHANRDDKEELKANMRKSAIDELNEMGHVTKNADAASRRTSKRNLRSKAKPDEGLMNGNNAHVSMCVTTFRSHFLLSEQEMDDDLTRITDDWHRMADDFKKSQDYPVSVEGGTLKYDNLVLEVGSYVLVQSEHTQTEATGHIRSITSQEMRVKCSTTGQRWQIQIEHLRTGRVHLFPGNAARQR